MPTGQSSSVKGHKKWPSNLLTVAFVNHGYYQHTLADKIAVASASPQPVWANFEVM